MVAESIKNSRYMQYLSAIIATISIASGATYNTWASPSLPKLTSEDSPIGTTITDEEGSWIASIYAVAGVLGSFMTAYMVEHFGRRVTLLLGAIPLFVPWIVVIYGKSALILILARFVAGMGGSFTLITAPIYIGEISEKDIRGKLGTAVNVLKLSGSLFVLSVGPFVSYEVLSWSCSAFPLVFGSLFFFMPESPYYLIKIGKQDAARRNLLRLSRKNTDEKQLNSRLSEIAETVDADMKNKSTLWEFVTEKKYRKSLVIILAIKTFQQFSGMNAIEAYMQTIIQSSASSISPEISSIVCGFIQIPAVLVAAALVDRLGRKPLLIISCVGCGTALIAEGTYFYLQDVVHADVSSISWLPTASLMLYLVMNPIGLFTLPYVLVGELFATNIKGIAVSVAGFYGAVSGFVVTKFFKPISNEWGMYTMFWIFAAVCILGALFAFFVLPETKGKTFAEIQGKLTRERKTKTDNDV